jgi:hypothetical protein
MAQMNGMQPAAATSTESNETQITRALSAAPPDVAKDATVAERDTKENMTILRHGTNDFACMPGDRDGPPLDEHVAIRPQNYWVVDHT